MCLWCVSCAICIYRSMTLEKRCALTALDITAIDFRKGAAYTGLLIKQYPAATVELVETEEIFNGVALDFVRNGKCNGLAIPEMHSIFLLKKPENCDIDTTRCLEMPMNYAGGVSRYSDNIRIETISYWIAFLRTFCVATYLSKVLSAMVTFHLPAAQLVSLLVVALMGRSSACSCACRREPRGRRHIS